MSGSTSFFLQFSHSVQVCYSNLFLVCLLNFSLVFRDLVCHGQIFFINDCCSQASVARLHWPSFPSMEFSSASYDSTSPKPKASTISRHYTGLYIANHCFL